MRKKKDYTLISNISFSYMYGCDYTYSRSCGCYGECTDDGYGRCSVITDSEVTSAPNTYKFVQDHYGDKDVITQFCIDRILTNLGFWNKYSYEMPIGGDYYGEEIGGVYFESAARADTLIDGLRDLSDTDKINSVLKLEYGFLLPKLDGVSYVVGSIPTKSIELVDDYRIKRDPEVIKFYKDYPFPRCIVEKIGDKYRIVDGHHRFLACDDDQISVIAFSK